MELILYLFCCYLNYSKAKIAKLNGFKWALFTFLAIMVLLLVAATLILVSMISKNPELQKLINEMSTTGNQDAVKKYIQENINFLNEMLMFCAGLGGYLYIKYILDKKIVQTNNNNPPTTVL